MVWKKLEYCGTISLEKYNYLLSFNKNYEWGKFMVLFQIIKYIFSDDVKRMYLVRNMYNSSNNHLKKTLLEYQYNKIMKRNGASIPIRLNVVATFPHGLKGVFISQRAKLGKNCVIFQHVTIGSNMLNNTKHRGAPTIGSNVYIGSGAKIIGNIIVGNSVRVGANAVICENIPANATVVLSKSRIIERDYVPDNRFIDISNLTKENDYD